MHISPDEILRLRAAYGLRAEGASSLRVQKWLRFRDPPGILFSPPYSVVKVRGAARRFGIQFTWARIPGLKRAAERVLGDWLIVPLQDAHRRDLLEILDDRYDTKSTMIASQLPVELWHEAIGDHTLADAILDRLVHNAYRLDIKGDSMRKTRANEAGMLDTTTKTDKPVR